MLRVAWRRSRSAQSVQLSGPRSRPTGSASTPRAELGERASHVVLLPPARLDAALLSGLDHLLRKNGIDPGRVSGFYGAYELRGRRLHCTVLSTTFKDGSERPVSFSIDLGGAFL